MLFAALFFIFAVAAADDELVQECQITVAETCIFHKMPSEIPDTIEGLQRDCRLVQDIVKCIIDENDKCEVKAFEAENMEKVAQFIETNCGEDSPLYQAANYEEHQCRLKVWSTCNAENFPSEFPDTIEDLLRDCRVGQNYIKCVLDENESCRIKAFDTQYLRKVSQYMETNCDADSSLYQALSRSYECIQPLAKNMEQICGLSDNEWEDLVDRISAPRDLSPTAQKCQLPLYGIMCTAHIVGLQCEQEAKATVAEILQNIKWDFQDCNEESIADELRPLKKILDSTFTEAFPEENGARPWLNNFFQPVVHQSHDCLF